MDFATILSHPQMGENIGASARAMKNCGLSDLRLVAPRDGWPNPSAEAMASGGADVLAGARVFATTAEATADLTLLVATTARTRSQTQQYMTPREAAAALVAHQNTGGRGGLLFGGERAGLTNDEVADANITVNVPLNPEFASLNLAQAVLLMGWECRMAWLEYQKNLGGGVPDENAPDAAATPATLDERAYFYDALEARLGAGGFFASPEMQPVIMRNIKGIFNKANLTSQEIQTLHGVLKAIEKSAKKPK